MELMANILWFLLIATAIVGLLILIGCLVTIALFGIKIAVKSWKENNAV